VPVTVDVEWGAVDDATAITYGYEQHGEIDARIELTEGVLELVGPGHRVHVWGAPYLPQVLAMPVDSAGLRGPYRRTDGINVDQVLTPEGWLGRTLGR
jgi:hypothetical protein